MIKEYWFNTGVKPFAFTPPAGMAFVNGFRDSGNGTYVIPFECEEVPEGYKPYLACDTIHKLEDDYIIREIKPGSRINSKFVYFIKF